MKITQTQAESYMKKAERLANTVKRSKAEIESAVNGAAETALATGTAFAFGVVHGRYENLTVAGVRPELLFGLSMTALALADVAPLASRSTGTGALCYYGAMQGASIGLRMRQKAAGLPAPTGADSSGIYDARDVLAGGR